MPYSIKTKDGIIINNIPDNIPSTDQQLKDRVTSLRSSGQFGASDFNAAPTPDPTTTTTTTVPQQPTETPVDPSKPQTSLLGSMGAVVRGAGPVAMGAAAGALMGAPFAGIGAIPGAIAGAGAAGLTQLVGDPIVGMINNLFHTKYTLPSDALEDLFTRLGVAEPKTEVERIIKAAASGAAGGISGVSLGQALQSGSGLGSSTIKNIGDMLASGPVQQIAGGIGAGAASQGAAEAGGGPGVQMAAGLAGGMLGSAVSGGANVKIGSPPTGPVEEAVQAKIRLKTSDVIPPDVWYKKLFQGIGEKIPFAGTGPDRVAQQAERVSAVKDLARQYGADNVAAASDDVMADLLSKRKTDHIHWMTNKTDVIDKLSFPKLDSTVPAPQGTVPTGKLAIDVPAGTLPATTGANAVSDKFWHNGTFVPGSPEAKLVLESKIVPMPATMQKIDDSIAYLEQLSPTINKPVINVLNTWKEAVQGKDLRGVEWLRKQIGEVFKAPEMASVRSTGESVLTDIYGAVKTDMTDYISKTGTPADLNKWQVANANLTTMMDELQLPLLKSTLKRGKTTPEVINRMLFSTKRSDVEALMRNLPPEDVEVAQTAVIADVVKKSGGLFDLSPNRFVDEIDRLGSQVGVLFSDDKLKQLNGLVRVLRATEHAETVIKAPATGLAGLVTTVGISTVALRQFFGKGVSGFLGTLGIGATIGGAARLYESAPVRDLLMKIPSVKIGSTEEAALFKRLLETVQAVEQSGSSKSRSTTPGGAR